MFHLCLITFQLGVKFCNSKWLIKVPHQYRIYTNACIAVVAYGLITYVANSLFEGGFWVAQVCSVLHGTVSGFGESTIIAWIKGFPGILIGAFSSGTGMSGLAGTSVFLIFKSFSYFSEPSKHHEGYIFLFMSVLIIPYVLSFLWLFRRKSTLHYVDEAGRTDADVKTLMEDEDVVIHEEEEYATDKNEQLTWKNF